MIRSFACRHTESLFSGGDPRPFLAFRRQAERKLAMLDAAASLDSLRSPPGNRLELLQGSRVGQYSIRINGQWRLCSHWRDGDAFDVAIVDYH